MRTELREKLDALEKTVKAKANDNEEPKGRCLKLNVISGKTFGMARGKQDNVNHYGCGSSDG